MIEDFFADVEHILERLTPETLPVATAWARLAMEVRGFDRPSWRLLLKSPTPAGRR